MPADPDSGVTVLPGADASFPDAAPIDSGIERPDPGRPDNPSRDSDCDGLNDAEEYGTLWPN